MKQLNNVGALVITYTILGLPVQYSAVWGKMRADWGRAGTTSSSAPETHKTHGKSAASMFAPVADECQVTDGAVQGTRTLNTLEVFVLGDHFEG